MRYVYGCSCLMSAHEIIVICGTYMVLERYICGWHIYDNNMVIEI